MLHSVAKSRYRAIGEIVRHRRIRQDSDIRRCRSELWQFQLREPEDVKTLTLAWLGVIVSIEVRGRCAPGCG